MKTYEVKSNLVLIDLLAEDINKWAEGKGFQDTLKPFMEDQNVGPIMMETLRLLEKSQKVALMHSELSEMLEGLRKCPPSTLVFEGTYLTNEEEELADLVIRALNYAGQFKLRLGAAIGAKMAKNEGRPHMHGKNF